eukprot:scaffold574571_cov20-Prasinocladus_malaysianus.AAC.1
MTIRGKDCSTSRHRPHTHIATSRTSTRCALAKARVLYRTSRVPGHPVTPVPVPLLFSTVVYVVVRYGKGPYGSRRASASRQFKRTSLLREKLLAEPLRWTCIQMFVAVVNISLEAIVPTPNLLSRRCVSPHGTPYQWPAEPVREGVAPYSCL